MFGEKEITEFSCTKVVTLCNSGEKKTTHFASSWLGKLEAGDGADAAGHAGVYTRQQGGTMQGGSDCPH